MFSATSMRSTPSELVAAAIASSALGTEMACGVAAGSWALAALPRPSNVTEKSRADARRPTRIVENAVITVQVLSASRERSTTDRSHTWSAISVSSELN
jgi:hypothetical protein